MRREGEGLGLSACCFASALILSLSFSTPDTRADPINTPPAESSGKFIPGLTDEIDAPDFLQVPSPPWTEEFLTRSKLTGDWDGRREALADNGLTFFGDVTQFYQGVTAGGLEQRFRLAGSPMRRWWEAARFMVARTTSSASAVITLHPVTCPS